MVRYGLLAVMTAGLGLAACASSSGSSGGHATAQDLLGLNHMQDASGIRTRDLLPEEKAVISHAVGLSVVNPQTAQYRWPPVANTEDGTINYCGMVNAKSPYAAYSGWQAYIVEGTVSGGKMTSAVVGLIAGGKDVEIVRKMCRKYGLDPGGTG
jgi:putative hemolysin